MKEGHAQVKGRISASISILMLGLKTTEGPGILLLWREDRKNPFVPEEFWPLNLGLMEKKNELMILGISPALCDSPPMY